MSKLYDRADIYDLIDSDQRTETVRRDWKEFLDQREIHTLLDVSIGTGSMTLPLQELGIEISGSDLSEAMLARCETKADAKGKHAELKCSDFRDLSCWEGKEFDCVVSTGNALGYVSNSDVALALEKMDSLVKPGGYLCYSTCTITKEENDEIADSILKKGFTASHFSERVPERLRHRYHDGRLQLFPQDGTDGFFTALFQKNGESDGQN